MKKDTIVCGILVALVGIVLSVIVLLGFMLLLALPPISNLKIFILSFIVPVVLLRYYVKKLQYISAAKGVALERPSKIFSVVRCRHPKSST